MLHADATAGLQGSVAKRVVRVSGAREAVECSLQTEAKLPQLFLHGRIGEKLSLIHI